MPGAEFESHIAAALDNSSDYYLRVAKLDEEVVGAYLMRRASTSAAGAPGAAGDAQTFLLDYLAVMPAQRKRGLGSWLTGHAIGIAESKGGSRLQVTDRSLVRFFTSYGFVDAGAVLQFDFIPE